MELSGNNTIAAAPCGIVGKEDLYGLGIRLGVYIQTLTLIISGILRQPGTAELANLGGLYQFALLFGVVYATVNMDDFHACEAVIMTVFSITCMGLNPSTFAVSMRIPNDESELNLLQRTFSPLYGTLLRYSVVVAIDAYQVWLWFVGLDRLAHTSCTRHTFFFARVDMYGGFRTFAKVFSVFIMVIATTFWTSLIISVVSWRKATYGSVSGAKNRSSGAVTRGGLILEPEERGLMSKLQNAVKIAPTLSMALLLILAVLAVELTIRWSHVHDVYSLTSVGQIIPLIMSLGGFVSVILKGKGKK